MILTNKYTVAYDMEQINKDFDIFVVEKQSSKLDETNVLDLATDIYKARAVQYTNGRKAYVLFDKYAATERQYREAITTVYPDVAVRKVDLLAMSEEELEKTFYWQKRLLAQLLMNSIRAPKQMGFAYNNLTGKLFYSQPEWKALDKKTKKPYMMYFLEIRFDAGMYLNLNVKTFTTKQKHSRKRLYVIDSKTKNFRRKLTNDNYDENSLFTETSFAHRKNTVPYLDFANFERFKSCKLGVQARFLQDVEKYLGKYMKLESRQREGDLTFQESKKEREGLTNTEYAGILNERGVNIVDECRDEYSPKIVARMAAELKAHYDITPMIGPLDKAANNIRLIHNQEYYEKNDLHDPHDDDLRGYIVQHLTEEENTKLVGPAQKKPSAVFHKIILELILKGDVRTGRISIFDWQALAGGKTWTFVRREKKRDIKPPKGGNLNTAGKTSFDYYQYTCLTIDELGSLAFTAFDDVELAKSEMEHRIRYVYDDYVFTQEVKAKKNIEGLVFSDLNNIHVIIQTNEKTMPDIRNIWTGLKETNDREVVLTGTVLDALDAYADICQRDTEYSEALKAKLTNASPTISKKELRTLMNMRLKTAKRFNRFLHENYNIWISPEIKDQDFEEDYLLENVLGIKYFVDDETDGNNQISFNYYVGPVRNSLQTSIHNASIVRQVMAEREIEFEKLLPLMAVDFVRIGQYTVLPFPFKYLREYVRMT